MNVLCLNIHKFDYETLIYDTLVISIFLIAVFCFNFHQFNYETLIYDDVMSLIFFYFNWMFSETDSRYTLCSTFNCTQMLRFVGWTQQTVYIL